MNEFRQLFNLFLFKVQYVEDAVRCAPKSTTAHLVYLSILETKRRVLTEETRELAPCLVDRTESLVKTSHGDNGISEDPEEWARFNSRHIQNVMEHQAHVQQVLSEKFESGIGAFQKDMSSKIEAASTQIRRDMSPAALSRQHAVELLQKELFFWDRLNSVSQENMVNAERRLNYPECLQAEDFCGCVIELENALERELKQCIYEPFQQAIAQENPPATSDISPFVDERGRPKFTLHSYASAIQSRVFQRKCNLPFTPSQIHQISNELLSLAKIRNRAAHGGTIGLREVRAFREGCMFVLDMMYAKAQP